LPNIRKPPEADRLTFDDLRRRPGRAVFPSDLAGLGLFHSYSALERAWKSGKLARPRRHPSGRPYWEGREILAMHDAA
jgi:hypothetical protein